MLWQVQNTIQLAEAEEVLQDESSITVSSLLPIKNTSQYKLGL